MALHHIENACTDQHYRDCIVDYECARFTKPDKPLNAYSTIKAYFPDKYTLLKPYLENTGINSARNIDIPLDTIKEALQPKLRLMAIKVAEIESAMMQNILSGDTLGDVVQNFNLSDIHYR